MIIYMKKAVVSLCECECFFLEIVTNGKKFSNVETKRADLGLEK